jgi:DNA-binding response OmpR family regulator
MPLIILSAKQSVDDRVKGLQTGSDDYLKIIESKLGEYTAQ